MQNPYEQYPFGGRISGTRGAPGKNPDVDAVIPKEDRKSFGYGMQFGWWLLNNQGFPPNGYLNPFGIYYVARSRKNFDFLLGVAPWIGLSLLEIGAIKGLGMANYQSSGWLGLMLFELFILPTLAGSTFCILFLTRIRDSCSRMNMAEVVLTAMRGIEILLGYLSRPLSAMMWGIFLNSVILTGLFAEDILIPEIVSSGFGSGRVEFGVGIFVVLLGTRFFMVRSMAVFGAICGLRAGLMIEQFNAAAARAARDYLYPYGGTLFLLPFVLIITTSILAVTPFALAICILVALFPVALIMTASLAEEHAIQILNWLGAVNHHWHYTRGEQSKLVPGAMREPWNLELRKRQRHHLLG